MSLEQFIEFFEDSAILHVSGTLFWLWWLLQRRGFFAGMALLGWSFTIP
jgi:hypothetical protein